jgi:hypothetical protein
MERDMIDYSLEHIFSYRVGIEKPQVIGPTAEGLRAVVPVAEGEITGPKLYGRVLPGSSGDWVTVRTDGIQVIDVRATVETDDGALIYASYTGIGDLGENGYRNYLKGVRPQTLAIRATARFQTAHPQYLWLNRLQCLNVGEINLEKREVRYDVYAVR